MIKYYGLFKDNILQSTSICKLYAEGFNCREITKEEYDEFDNNILKKIKIIELKDKLKENDDKSIRAIRSNETKYIQEYENKAQALRAELQQLEKEMEN